MATDSSPPKIRVILTVAFSSIVILGALNFVFRSYYQMMTDEVEHARLRPAEQLIKLREGEQKNLTSGPMPIEKAMAALAAKGREADEFKDITPQASNDLGPMVGWAKAPNQAVVDAINAAEAAKADASAAVPEATDGGRAMAEAGAAPLAGGPAADGGAVVAEAGVKVTSAIPAPGKKTAETPAPTRPGN